MVLALSMPVPEIWYLKKKRYLIKSISTEEENHMINTYADI